MPKITVWALCSEAQFLISGDVTATGDNYAADIEAYAFIEGTADVKVEGSVESSGCGILITAGKTESEGDILIGTVTVEVGGDVKTTSEDMAALLINVLDLTPDDSEGNTDIDVIVGGELSAKGTAIQIGENVAEDDLTLTVWKVSLDEDGDAVKQFVENEETYEYELQATDTSKAVQENILYIIKLEQPNAGATLSATDDKGAVLEKSGDYDVAKENDTVLLKVDLSDGYSLLGAYNGDGEKVALLTDSNGNYYVIVPRGGGVYLSVSLSAPTVKSASYDFSGASRAVVTFDLDGGELDGAVDGVYTVNTWTGNYIHLPEEPEKEGYEFDGWTLDENVYRAGQSFTVKADSITFKALWKETTAA